MTQSVEQFITHWKDAKGGERAQSQSFLNDLCELLQVSKPKDGDYKFEYALRGDRATDFVDLYKRGCFVLESKQSRAKGQKKAVEGQEDMFAAVEQPRTRDKSSRAWDVLMLNARQQAENYARHLPSSHEWPPFILVCDVGHCFEVYADFTGKGRNYTQFPDRQGFRVFIDDFRKPEVREQFKKMWEDPHALDHTKRAAKATRLIAERLAEVSKRLEARKFPAENVALFLMRCIFTMFAEDVKLLPQNSLTNLLLRCVEKPQMFVPELEMLWKAMDVGDYAPAAQERVKRFNGFLFKGATAYELEKAEIGELLLAAKQDWSEVDPSIFGTLLEQALDPLERSRLGAHYTPRAYVERMVVATVIEPLRQVWNNVQGSLEVDPSEALTRVKVYHQSLCEARVLDPACGTGNFLYVTLELMKRLEGEVLDMIERLGGQEALRLERFTVDPHQFLGLELNPRAAAIAELVLWIGYLRWHLKTKGEIPPEPILREFKNIERRDAALAHDGIDAKGTYVNPRRPEWPEAEYIVGNPPFLGKGEPMRTALGEHYVDALRAAETSVNDSADFVMYWWDHAASLLTRENSKLKRFGLVTTNSITQVFNRRVVEHYLHSKEEISVIMAIADHPWTKATPDSAAVRIAMTVAERGNHAGVLLDVTSESNLDTDEPKIDLRNSHGKINSDLTIGVDLTKCADLIANHGMSSNGVMLAGRGFVLSRSEAENYLQRDGLGAKKILRLFVNGGDLVRHRVPKYIIDTYGTKPEELRDLYPNIYQHLLSEVKVERDVNRDKAFREKWWLFGRNRPEVRFGNKNIPRFIATTETAKHRVFQFLDSQELPDHMIISIASADAFHLGVLSSHLHVLWAIRTGGWLGVGNDPRYSKSRCFDPFPFPDADASERAKIAALAEAIDSQRKDVQASHPDITLTQMYNVLEKVHSAAKLTIKERRVFDDALILILNELHEELDAAVAASYGWSVDLSDEEILGRLVALNKERAAEEAKGHVRWLRPEYQIPRFGTAKDKQEQIEADLDLAPLAKVKPSYPAGAVEQTAAVMAALAVATTAVTAGELAQGFKQGKKAEARITATLSSLARTGFISALEGGKRFSLRRIA